MIFYHGGCEPDFTVEKIDILRIAEKQQIENGHFNDFIEAKEKDMKKIAILREQQVQNNMQMNQNASINISR